MDLLNWKISHMDNTYSGWPSLIRIVLFRSKEIHGAVCPIQIFTTKKYWILFFFSDRPGEERLECQQASIFWIHPTRKYTIHFGNVRCQSHWMGKSPIPKTNYFMYFIRPLGYEWVFSQRFLLYQSTPVWFLLKHILLGEGRVQGGRFQNRLPIH